MTAATTNNNDPAWTDIFKKMINYEDRRPVAEQYGNNSNSSFGNSSDISSCNKCSSSSQSAQFSSPHSPPCPPHPPPSSFSASNSSAFTTSCPPPPPPTSFYPQSDPSQTPSSSPRIIESKGKANTDTHSGSKIATPTLATGTAVGSGTISDNVLVGSLSLSSSDEDNSREFNFKGTASAPPPPENFSAQTSPHHTKTDSATNPNPNPNDPSNKAPVTKSNSSINNTKETGLLQCPHCYKSLYFPMYERPEKFKTTDKRRLNRFCGFFAVFLSLFLLLSSLLESADIDNDALISGAHYWTNQSYKIKRLPQCIIIGARKCGTRALIDMLNLHPQVEKAAMEVHFFDRDDNYAKGLEWYRQHLPECSEDQLSIEKSPSYFVTPEVPERIHAMNSSIKLLLIVREPVTRVISDYTQIYGTNLRPHNGSKSPRLEDLVLQSDGSVNVHYKAIRISLYSRYLQRWLDVFPPTQILVIDGDALIRDPYPQLRDVERFLGLEPRLQRDNFYFNSTKGFYCWRKLEGENRNETGLHCLNDSKGRRHPPVDRYIVSKLRRFYNPHNLRFYEMVGKDFSWPEK